MRTILTELLIEKGIISQKEFNDSLEKNLEKVSDEMTKGIIYAGLGLLKNIDPKDVIKKLNAS